MCYTPTQGCSLAYMGCKSRFKSQTSVIKWLGVAYKDVQLYYYLHLSLHLHLVSWQRLIVLLHGHTLCQVLVPFWTINNSTKTTACRFRKYILLTWGSLNFYWPIHLCKVILNAALDNKQLLNWNMAISNLWCVFITLYSVISYKVVIIKTVASSFICISALSATRVSVNNHCAHTVSLDFGKERSVSVDNMSADQVAGALQTLVQSKPWPCWLHSPK